MRENFCFFTGHRVLPAGKSERIQELLKSNIMQLADNGVTTFIAGGALGFDMLAANTVLELKHSCRPDIRLWLYIPCVNHTERWSEDAKLDFFTLRQRCDKVLFVSKNQYTRECMLRRNRKMAEDAFWCVAFLLSEKSGTGHAVRYAKQLGNRVINIADELYESK